MVHRDVRRGEGGLGRVEHLRAFERNLRGRRELTAPFDARAFLINTEGATDAVVYEKLVGVAPGGVATAALERS